MKRVLSVKDITVCRTIGSLKAAHRCGFSRGLGLGLILLAVFIVLSGNLLYGEESDDALYIDQNGNVGIGTSDPKAQLHVHQEKPGGSEKLLYVTGDFPDGKGVEFRHKNGSQGIGFNYNTIYATGYNKDQSLNLKPQKQGQVSVQGDLTVEGTIRAKVGTIPIGGIIMWSGTTIPQGWRLCNGSAGTPDLRGRFVLGSGSGKGLAPREIGVQGGEENHQLTIDEMPRHNHLWKARAFHDWEGGGGAEWHWEQVFNNSDSREIEYTGGDKPHNNMPPFYVLSFIMRVQ